MGGQELVRDGSGLDLDVDLLIYFFADRHVDGIDQLKMQAQLVAVTVFGHPAAQRFAKLIGRHLDPVVGEPGEPVGIGFAAEHGLDPGPTGHGDDTETYSCPPASSPAARVHSRIRVSWV